MTRARRKPSTSTKPKTAAPAAARGRAPGPQEVPPGYPHLASGSADPKVLGIVGKLHQLGYTDLVMRPEVTPELLAALNAWRDQEGIAEAPESHVGFPAGAVIATETWRALLAIPDPEDAA